MGWGSLNPFKPGSVYEKAGQSVSQVVSGAGSVLAKIDPGPAIGKVGVAIDKAVGDNIPGGWAVLGVAALMVVAPYLAPYLAEMAAVEAGTATAWTAEVAATQQAAALQSALSAAGTGSLYGGGLGAVNSVIKGTDPIKGAITGALMGALTGASLSGINQTLAQAGINSPTLSSAILSTAKGLASGANPTQMLADTALNSGLSFLGNQASTTLKEAGLDPNLSKILASTGVGAAKAGATGGDVLTGAENAALGSTIGLGLNTGINEAKGLLTAPTASAEPATIHDYSTPIPNGTVQLAGMDNPVTMDIASQYLKNQADQVTGDLAKYYPTLSEQQAALADASTKVSDLYTKNQADKAAFNDTLTKTGYNDLRDSTTELAKTAKALYDQVSPIQAQYDAAVKTYEESGRTDKTAYDLANSLAPKLTELIPQFNTALQAFDTSNQSLDNLYKTTISPLEKALATGEADLKTALANYTTNETNLAKTSNFVANDLKALDQISQGQLATGWNPGEATMQAPTNNAAPADAYYNQLVDAFANPDQPSTTGSQTAANGTVTIEGAPPTMTDVGGGATTPYVPTTSNVLIDAFPDTGSPSGYSNNDGDPVNSDGTPYVDTTSSDVSPIDIIANLPTNENNTSGALPTTPVQPTTPVDTGVLPTTPVQPTTPVDTGALPTTPVQPTTPVDTGALPTTTVPPTTPVDTGTLPTTPVDTGTLPTTPVDTGTLPTTPVDTGTDDGGTTTPSTTTPSTTTPSTTTPSTTTPSTTTPSTTTPSTTTPSTTTPSTTTPSTTTPSTTTPSTTTPSTTTPSTTTPSTTAGLTAAGLASALAGLGLTGSRATTGLSSVDTNPASPKGTLVKGSQIASPLGSFNVPTINYANQGLPSDSLEQIENAANGGIMHLAGGGSSEDELSLKPVLMRGKQTQHANLFGLGGIPLYPVPGKAEGGSIPQGFNPQFYSEGGLGSMQNAYVRGPGSGTSDSIPAMLSNGEFVIPADVVSSLGNGSNDSGAQVLDSFLKTIRAHKQKHDTKHIPKDSKGALGYLLEAKRKVKK